MQWSDFLSAVALLFIFEGILPFISPNKTREFMQRFEELNNPTLRLIGVSSMLAGLVILYLVR